MKEQLYTIPLMDAFRANDECPFCFIERDLEQHALDFVLGSGASYMRDDIRAATDQAGFCREHYQKMFSYGNRLGSALILETHLKKLTGELKKEMKNYSSSAKPNLADRFRKNTSAVSGSNNVSIWIRKQNHSCYICDYMHQTHDRYLATFFELFKKGEPEFMELVKSSKGFCLTHFAELLDASSLYLNDKKQEELRSILFPQMEKNLERIQEDIDWFQKKFDYRFQDADWKNSRDSVQRAMQKIGSGYPADPPYQAK